MGWVDSGRSSAAESGPLFETIVALAAALEVAPTVLFHFDRAETDPAVLRQRIARIVAGCTEQQLRQAYRVMSALADP